MEGDKHQEKIFKRCSCWLRMSLNHRLPGLEKVKTDTPVSPSLKSSLPLWSYSCWLPSWGLAFALCWHRDFRFIWVRVKRWVLRRPVLPGRPRIQLGWHHHATAIFWTGWKLWALNRQLKSSFESFNTTCMFLSLWIFVGREVFELYR